ncbi:MAG: hypothetical protein GY799_25360 [Desulfobulbaceae bacterium]|nr:hypothetical protein [Desulfobulbaceae bacterium]
MATDYSQIPLQSLAITPVAPGTTLSEDGFSQVPVTALAIAPTAPGTTVTNDRFSQVPVAALAIAPIAFASTDYLLFTASTIIEQEIYAATDVSSVIRQIIYSDVEPNTDIQQVITANVATHTVTIEQVIYAEPTINTDIQQIVYDIYGSQSCYGISISVGGSGMSVVGAVNIRAAESSSGVATFTVLDSASLDVMDSVVISIDDGMGQNLPRFTGVLAGFVPDIDNGTIKCTASTDLRGEIEALSKEQILALAEGSWSKYVFDEDVGTWEYFLDVMSTVPAEVHVDQYGLLQKTDWESVAAGVSYASSTRFGDSLEVSYVDKADLVNQNRLTIEYRFDRRVMKQGRISWDIGLDPCELLGWGNDAFYGLIPNKNNVTNAFSGIGWDVSVITWTQLPEPGIVRCGSGQYDIIVWAGGSDNLVMGAAAVLAKSFDVEVTHSHVIEINCPESQTTHGIIPVEEEYGVESTEQLSVPENDGRELHQSKYGATGILGEVTVPRGGFGSVSGGVFGDNEDGDYYDADNDYEGLDECIEIAVERAKVEMLDTHRQTRVSFDVPFTHAAFLDKTASIASGMSATGKIAEVADTINADTGEAITRITMAISGTTGQGVDAATTTLDPVVIPGHDRPLSFNFTIDTVFNQTPPDEPEPEDSAYYTQRLVGTPGGGTQLPPVRVDQFIVVGPAIPEEETAPVEELFEREIILKIPVDSFVHGQLHSC